MRPHFTLAFIGKKGHETSHPPWPSLSLWQLKSSNYWVTSQEYRYVFVLMWQMRFSSIETNGYFGIKDRGSGSQRSSNPFGWIFVFCIIHSTHQKNWFVFLLLSFIELPFSHNPLNTHWIFGWSKQYPWILIHLTKWLLEKYKNQAFKPKQYQFTRNHALVQINQDFFIVEFV